MDKNELLDYLKKRPDKFKSLYTEENISKINWDYIPEELIDKNKAILENFDWFNISSFFDLSEVFIAKHKNWVRWSYISIDQKLSEDFITEYKDFVKWRYISKYQRLSEEFVEKYKNLVDWDYISAHQKLSESFITKYKELVNWHSISVYQKLSEDFITKHKDFVSWSRISAYQKLSEGFIAKHKNYVNWNYISKYQKLSEGFISEYKIYFNMYNVHKVKDNWLNKSTEFKKEAVVKTGLYECYEDYFIAYKGIRSDRYSAYNFQYQYMPGETYECFSDGSDDKASFGLSVWTKEEAAEYCDELVVKCKVYYEDVTRVINSDCKIRCSKITVLD